MTPRRRGPMPLTLRRSHQAGARHDPSSGAGGDGAMSAAAPEPINASAPTTSPAGRRSRGSAKVAWAAIALRAPQLTGTRTAFLDQLTVSSRPATVSAALVLRQFADHLTR